MSKRSKRPPARAARDEPQSDNEPSELRIIGGAFRGRKLLYSGRMATRPMKDRLREAVFNRIGPAVVGTHAIDLFAGTGALGFEAVSRGARRATLVEQHFPTAGLIRQQAAELGLAERCEIAPADAFIWVKRAVDLGDEPRLVFVSPPWELFASRTVDMLEMIELIVRSAPAGSIVVVESDEHFDTARLPDAAAWDVRPHLPAVVAIWRTP